MKRFFKLIIWSLSAVVFLGLCSGVYFWYVWSSNLPFIGTVKEYRPPIITEIFSDDGEIIGRLWEEKRTILPLDQMPKHLIQAFVAAEDSRFFEHEGVDIKSIFRAFIKNMSTGKIKQGGSTITQQVTKSLLLKNIKRTYRRKVREAILSLQLEKEFSKEHILFLYLNQIYLGQGAYGVEAAARTYFNKPAKDLNLAESAILAGLPQAPARYSPVAHFERAKARQKYVLERMREEGLIDDKEFDRVLNTKLDIRVGGENTFERAPYFTEHVRRFLLKKYGKELLYRGGLKVYTSLDLKMQGLARKALNKGLYELDKREGYRGPVKHLADGDIPDFRIVAAEKFKANLPETGSIVQGLVVKVDDKKKEVTIQLGEEMACLPLKGMKWARKPNKKIAYYSGKIRRPSQALKSGDVALVRILKNYSEPQPALEGKEKKKEKKFTWEVALEQLPEAQGALFCMDPETGEVKAMVGGRDFKASQFNRAIQSRRQPGSAFKPLIYSAALDKAMSAASIIMDAPYVSKQNLKGESWKPKNYKKKFYGPTLLRTGLAKSRNVITVKILKKIGINHVIDYAKNMGIESPLAPDLSLALGSSGLSLMEITRAYAVFANGGMLVKPIYVKRILDRNGEVIEENQTETVQAIPKETAFLMTDLLRAVITEGTGWRIRAMKRPAAGKTGTTNDLKDAWFLGYTPGLVTGVWVGYDDAKEMGKGETGSRAASPIWLGFMAETLKETPVKDFKVPEGIVFTKIDAKTGLLAGRYSKKTVFQSFKEGTEPKKYSPKPASAKLSSFSQFDMDSE
ncbi:MAG: PBP1A family penicillin-binding protein [Desulfobacteraceae bacterium]|uniref:Penicillin-binding protein 1A n=1 Tax=Candidatus Desulfacyla euxinica TaxID=2841693 RepID=A0A8J6N226_9DELT|nr:PBP1A family penicillin-binding protein [Candidatus Desulfacyla euxinica]MBL6977511.1 PBP1A family penicillin-binding protein [Desulfobacteraceae bacterium]MBL7216178.1 PBP1A family penicillin-binding protein [Desulfobacteraceae bacterium]